MARAASQLCKFKQLERVFDRQQRVVLFLSRFLSRPLVHHRPRRTLARHLPICALWLALPCACRVCVCVVTSFSHIDMDLHILVLSCSVSLFALLSCRFTSLVSSHRSASSVQPPLSHALCIMRVIYCVFCGNVLCMGSLCVCGMHAPLRGPLALLL